MIKESILYSLVSLCSEVSNVHFYLGLLAALMRGAKRGYFVTCVRSGSCKQTAVPLITAWNKIDGH
jgi:hypothetical protein